MAYPVAGNAFSDRPILASVLVGREREMESLERALAAVQGGTGQCLILAGEAGIGKSRLVVELGLSAAARGFLTLSGQCFEQDLSFPFAPFIDMLRLFCSRRSAAEIQTTMGPLAVELVKLLPELSLSLPEAQPSPALEPEAEKRRLFASLAQFLIHLTERSPVLPLLVVVEDLHWSDETSLDFVHFFARRLVVYPILLLLTYRREEASPALVQLLVQLDRERLAREIGLELLTRIEVETMLRAVFEGSQPIWGEFLETIYALTEGSPFFVEELLKSLVAAGDIFYAAGRWERKPLPELHIPRSVYAAVQRRVKGLSQAARTVLTLAAVAGRRFDFTLLQQVARLDEGALLPLIKELVAAQLVVEASAEQFTFRHALTREAIYSELLARERQALHHTLAETMEQLYGDSARLETYLPDLAYHFYEAKDWAKALAYARRAGEEAQALYASHAAVEQFSRALNAAQQGALGPIWELYRARGKAYGILGEFNHALGDGEAALQAARTTGDRSGETQALLDLGFLWESRDWGRAGGYYQEALTLARSLNDPLGLAHTLNRLGNWRLNIGQPLAALPYHSESLTLFEGLNDLRGMAETLNMLGTASYNGGDLIQGTVYLEQAVTLFRQVHDRYGLVNVLVTLTLHSDFETEVWGVAGLGEIVRGGEEAVQLARSSGWRSDEAHTLIRLAVCLGWQGEYGRAFAAVQAGLAIAQEIEHREWLSDAHYVLGLLLLDLLAAPEAQQRLEQSLTLAKEIGSRLMIYVASSRLAEAYLLQQKFERVEAVLNGALAPETLPRTGLERRIWRARAELALARGEPEQGLQMVNHLIATALHVEKYEEGCIPRLWQLRGEALGLLKQYAEAEVALQAAQKFAQAQSARPMLWRIQAALGKVYQAQARRAEAEREFAAARTLINELAAELPNPVLRNNFLSQASTRLPPASTLSPRQAAKRAFAGLTGREREVAALVAQGKSNRDIATTLVVSERTVTTHVGNILAKLGFTSRTQIATWATEKGLSQPQAD